MPKLSEMVSEIPDESDYEGAVFIALNGINVVNIGFAGKMPEGVEPREYLFQKFHEAMTALAFPPDS